MMDNDATPTGYLIHLLRCWINLWDNPSNILCDDRELAASTREVVHVHEELARIFERDGAEMNAAKIIKEMRK